MMLQISSFLYVTEIQIIKFRTTNEDICWEITYKDRHSIIRIGVNQNDSVVAYIEDLPFIVNKVIPMNIILKIFDDNNSKLFMNEGNLHQT